MNTTFSTTSTLPLEEKPVGVLWGCELNSSNRKCVVKVEDNLLEHIVYLKSVTLGEGAKDELHVVAVESRNMTSVCKPVPIVSLQRSVLPTVNLGSFEFTPPVAFVLKSGTGPVYLVGQHLILEGDSDYESPEYDTQTDEAQTDDTHTDDVQTDDTQTDVDTEMDGTQTAEDTQMDGTQADMDDTQTDVDDSGSNAAYQDYPGSTSEGEDESRHR